MAGTKKGAPVKAQGKRSPHIVVLDADPAILDYVKSILEDRFTVTLLTEAAELEAASRILLPLTCS